MKNISSKFHANLMFTDETSRTRVPQRKAHDELVTIYQQILHSEVSQPLSP